MSTDAVAPPLAPCTCDPSAFDYANLATHCRPVSILSQPETPETVRFRSCPCKELYFDSLVEKHHSSLKQESRDFYRLDNAKPLFEKECDYILNETEWEGVKRRCSFSNEHAVDALDKLITEIDSHPQESPLYLANYGMPNVKELELGEQLVKKELLVHLNLLKKYLPNWYNLPPPLAIHFKAIMANLLRCSSLHSAFYDRNDFSYVKMHLPTDSTLEDLPASCYDFKEHPYKWLREVLSYLKNLRDDIYGSYTNQTDGSFFDFPTTDLIISVKEFAYLNGNCEKLMFIGLPENTEEAIWALDSKEENDLIYAYRVATDQGENLPAFAHVKSYPAFEALGQILQKGSKDQLFWKRLRPFCQMRWLLQATKRNLTQLERNYVHNELWNLAQTLVFDRGTFQLYVPCQTDSQKTSRQKISCVLEIQS